MTAGELSSALEREHRDIDAGIEAFTGAGGTEEAIGALRRAMAGLRRHIYLEEEFIFPTLRRAGMGPPVFVMLREHGELWRGMQEVDAELSADRGSAPAKDACDRLLTQLEAHNAKEEPIIYPQADAQLDTGSHAHLMSFLASGEMPAGWACEKA